MNVTAVVLSPERAGYKLPGITVLNHASKFSSVAGYNNAMATAVGKVKTDWFFMLNWDDSVPEDYLSVIADCVDGGHAVAYTDEKVVTQNGSKIRVAGAYSQEEHLRNAFLMHHLVVCKTGPALEAIASTPRDEMWLDMLLYFQLAKKGVKYVPRIGYNWNKTENGFHKTPGMLRHVTHSAIWCSRNRG